MRLIAKKQSDCRGCRGQILTGEEIDWFPGYGARHVNCDGFAACPNCGIGHHATAQCYGGFDPDVEEIRWDGQG